MSGGGLSNADFRTILMTPKRGEESSIPEFKAPKGGNKDKKKKDYSNSNNNKPRKPKEKIDSRYRDRAEERRLGISDYNDEEILTAFNAVPPPNLKGEAAAKAKQEVIEKSKFLGGDIEHTHLVKGLDYALLKKARSDMANADTIKKEEEFEEIAQEQEETYYKTISVDKPVVEPKKEEEEDKALFHTVVGRSVYETLFSTKPKKPSSLFINGRMLFMFDLSESDIPTTIVKSKEDLPKFKELIIDSVDNSVLEKVTSIMGYIRSGGKKLKKKEETTTSNSEPSIVQATNKMEEDDSIYGDIGEYKPSLLASKDTKVEKQAYFAAEEETSEMAVDAPMLPEQLRKKMEEVKKKAGGEEEDDEDYVFDINQFDKRIDAEKYALEVEVEPKPKTLQEEIDAGVKKPNIDPKKDPSYISDDYAECYPGTYESTFLDVEGSDDEEDYSKMDVGRNLRLHRKDFSSEEAWGSYNDNREALPKAAFQFGVKMGDGRKTRKNKNTDKKIESELKKINQIIKRKENALAPSVPTALEARKKMKNE